MKRTWLRILLLALGLYIAYVAVGIALLYTGKTGKWTIFPGKMLTASNWDVDDSNAGPDGPYVFYAGGKILRRTIIQKESGPVAVTDSFQMADRSNIAITCSFPDHPEWDFSTRLKDTLINEPAVYPAARELLVLSDIEGNFGAFRSLLLAGGVMDTAYRWTFGAGEVVLVGDFFDRGLYVTECLWLIYHLEQEAERAGGKLHFILGNHEIMNMQGDLRYVRARYIKNAGLLEVDYGKWFSPETELGRWLQTKNIAEQVGTLLFVHGGISEEVLALRLPLDKLNALCRPWYFTERKALKARAPEPVKTLFDSKSSPFWYRGLVQEEASEAHVDAVLQQYSVTGIVVGHTLVDHISTFYKGKVIATDVHHSEGRIEALRVHQGGMSRIDTSGNAVTLIDN